MKLSELIDKLQQLAKDNDLGASHDVMVYDNYNGNWHELDIKIACGDLAIEISIEE